jgi:hypothetical protein
MSAAAAMRLTQLHGSAGIPLAPIIYAVNKILDTVTPVSTVTNTAGKPIKVGRTPVAIAIAP